MALLKSSILLLTALLKLGAGRNPSTGLILALFLAWASPVSPAASNISEKDDPRIATDQLDGSTEQVVRLESGSLVIRGNFTNVSNQFTHKLAVLTSQARVQTVFPSNQWVGVSAIAPAGSTAFIAAIEHEAPEEPTNYVQHFSASGAAFGEPLYLPHRPRAIAKTHDGATLVVGRTADFNDYFTHTDNRRYAGGQIARFLSDGQRDTNFLTRVVGHGNIFVETTGHFWLAGPFRVYQNPFQKVVFPSDQNPTLRRSIARFHADGRLDESFVSQGNGAVEEMVRRPNGELLISGAFSVFGGVSRPLLASLDEDGRVNESFAPDTWKWAPVTSIPRIAVTADNEVAVLLTQHKTAKFFLLNPDGSEDSAFGIFEFALTTTEPETSPHLTMMSDGSFLVLGPFSSVNGIPRKGVVRIRADGTLASDAPVSFTGITPALFQGRELFYEIREAGRFRIEQSRDLRDWTPMLHEPLPLGMGSFNLTETHPAAFFRIKGE